MSAAFAHPSGVWYESKLRLLEKHPRLKDLGFEITDSDLEYFADYIAECIRLRPTLLREPCGTFSDRKPGHLPTLSRFDDSKWPYRRCGSIDVRVGIRGFMRLDRIDEVRGPKLGLQTVPFEPLRRLILSRVQYSTTDLFAHVAREEALRDSLRRPNYAGQSIALVGKLQGQFYLPGTQRRRKAEFICPLIIHDELFRQGPTHPMFLVAESDVGFYREYERRSVGGKETFAELAKHNRVWMGQHLEAFDAKHTGILTRHLIEFVRQG